MTRRVLVLLILAAARAAAGQGVVTGVVVDKEARQPLGYSAVAVVGQSIERLTTAAGRFVIPLPQVGRVRIRVRHVGYEPLDMEVNVVAGDTATVRIELSHIPVILPAIQAGDEPCREPGAPAKEDSALAAAFQQLELNAEQFRLLGTQYPFASDIERRFSKIITVQHPQPNAAPMADTAELPVRSDTISVRSDAPWHYEPGRVISAVDRLGLRWAVNIPTLAVFMDHAFQVAHCFRSGGLVELDGARYLRIDFRAAESIRDPDLNGAMYLDPVTYAIRRSVISLSRPSPHASAYDSVSVETRFEDLVPGVPVIALITGRNALTAEAGVRGTGNRTLPPNVRVLTDLERQRVQAIRFLGARPFPDSAQTWRPPTGRQ